jgi:hypothetical protein
MATIPSLALIPSGYKASKVYSVLPTDGTGDFDFTRSGNATRVNSEGLIELVSTNVPRLNYPLIDGVVNGCPSLLLEPQRINLLPYSEQFDNAAWTKSGATITANATTSPDGTTNADSFIGNGSNAEHSILQSLSFIGGTTYTISFYAKKNTNNFIQVVGASSAFGANVWANFDLNSGVVGSVGSSTTASIQNVGDGWYRCTAIAAAIATTSTNIVMFLINSSTSSRAESNSLSTSVYLYGAQLEQGSYATSYIPTSGTTATRSAETCNNAGDANTFNDSEGILFAEISALANDGTNRRISISNGSTSDRIVLGYTASSNQLIVLVSSNSVSGVASIVNINNSLQFNKIALKYKLNDFALWINGIEVLTDNSLNSPIGLNDLSFEGADNLNDFYGSTKQIQYYNTALNDSDLETLTSWDSFSDMAIGQLYTIE